MTRGIRAGVYGGDPARRPDYRRYGRPAYDRRQRTDGRTAAYDRGDRMRNTGRKSRRKKKAGRRILFGIAFYFMLAGIIATCWVIISFFFGKEEKVHAEGVWIDDIEMEAGEEGFSEKEASGENDDGFSLEVTPEIRQECQELYARQEELLLLVNKDHELQAFYQPVLHSICKGRLEAADILYEDLCALLAAGGDAGYQYWIASAHRDRSYQQGLVDEDVQKYMAKGYTYEAALAKTYEYTMPAGQSEHETGLALDILCSTNTMMDESQAYEPGNKWLLEHCHEYGFILRYPADKEVITGIKYEPWHFRYVGKEAAVYLKEKGWTLEEFYGVVNGII